MSSFADIRLVGGESASGGPAALRTDALARWGAGSLLIGGLRRETSEGVAVEVRSSSVTLDNPGDEFAAPEIILAAKGQVMVEAGSSLAADDGGAGFEAEQLLFSGAGALLRVSADKTATASRSATGNEEDISLLSIGAGSFLSGAGVTIDSSSAVSLDFTSTLVARSLAVSSGQISVLLGPYDGDLDGNVVESHLVLDDETLSQLGSVEVLRLASYRTIDFYGSGTLGSSELGRLEPDVVAGQHARIEHGSGAKAQEQRQRKTGQCPQRVRRAAAASDGPCQVFEAVERMDRKVPIDMRQQRPDARGSGLESFIA